MSQIHEKGLSHRDIKPENFIVLNDKQDEPFLADFGFSKRLRGNCYVPSEYDIVTYTYRAPELFRYPGCKKYGQKVDEWSVGCLLLGNKK